MYEFFFDNRQTTSKYKCWLLFILEIVSKTLELFSVGCFTCRYSGNLSAFLRYLVNLFITKRNSISRQMEKFLARPRGSFIFPPNNSRFLLLLNEVIFVELGRTNLLERISYLTSLSKRWLNMSCRRFHGGSPLPADVFWLPIARSMRCVVRNATHWFLPGFPQVRGRATNKKSRRIFLCITK